MNILLYRHVMIYFLKKMLYVKKKFLNKGKKKINVTDIEI